MGANGRLSKRLPGAGHADIEQATQRIPVLAPGSVVPAAVEDAHVVELEPLRTMTGQEQKVSLLAAGVS